MGNSPGTWAWACERMLRGREMRRASWHWSWRINLADVGQGALIQPSDFVATDWELAS